MFQSLAKGIPHLPGTIVTPQTRTVKTFILCKPMFFRGIITKGADRKRKETSGRFCWTYWKLRNSHPPNPQLLASAIAAISARKMPACPPDRHSQNRRNRVLAVLTLSHRGILANFPSKSTGISHSTFTYNPDGSQEEPPCSDTYLVSSC
jgi:hypothetical protein